MRGWLKDPPIGRLSARAGALARCPLRELGFDDEAGRTPRPATVSRRTGDGSGTAARRGCRRGRSRATYIVALSLFSFSAFADPAVHAMFDRTHLHDVRISMPGADWARLRATSG